MLGLELGQEGMVAVVQGLPESALAVTLLDGSKQYTLMPNGNCQDVKKPVQNASTEVSPEIRSHGCSHSATQAVDGRYASVYKTTHCKLQPTSPTVELTEFPPQRAELSRGLGNFEVGGHGSGDTFSPTKATSSYRGGLTWPERGAVCAPRQVYEPDAFASSLRKYPNLSPDRSTELVERLINYAHYKNGKSTDSYCGAKLLRSQTSPSRSESNSQGTERRSCLPSMRAHRVELDVNLKSKVPDESPTKDTTKKCDYESFEYRKCLYGRNFDVRHVQDMSKKIQDSIKNLSSYPYNHPVCPNIKARYDHLPPERKQREILEASSPVHMETQAEIPMVSIEVSTLPREQPVTRNIAIPLSPDPSCSNCAQVLPNSECKHKCSCKSIQTPKLSDHTLKTRKSVQTCISSIDLLQNNDNKIKNGRKSKSQEELRKNDDIKEELLQLIKGLRSYTDFNVQFGVKNTLLRRLKTKKKLNDEFKVPCNISKVTSRIDLEKNEDSGKIRRRFKMLHSVKSTCNLNIAAENEPCCSHYEESRVDELIKEWLKNIPFKSEDSDIKIKNENLINSLAHKIKTLVKEKVQSDSFVSLKPEIFGLIEDVPLNTNNQNKSNYVNGLVNDLFKNIDNIFVIGSTYRKKWNKTTDKSLKFNIQPEILSGTHVQPTEDELKHFVKQEINDFAIKFHLKICPETREDIQVELTDLLIDSIEAIRYGNDKQVKEEILVILYDFIDISQHEAVYFVNNIIYNIKDMFKESLPENTMPQTFVVLQNTEHDFHSANNTGDFSIEAVTDEDIQNYLELYTQQIVNQINEWMSSIPEINNIEPSFKQVVVNDLAADIIDRQKYLEISPNSRGTHADELEHLKYQIFKWVNKLVGDDNSGAIEQASELMNRIQSVPAPILTRLNVSKMQSPCCQENQQSQRPSISNQQNTQPRRPSVSHGKPFDCCAEQMSRRNGSPTSNRTAFTETDKYQMPKTRLQGTNMSVMEVPKELEQSHSRRHSTPGGYPTYPPEAVYKAPVPGYSGNTSAKSRSINEQRNNNIPQVTPSPQQLNEEYDEYLKNWVKQIPIDLGDEITDTVRLGIYRGIWNAITKLGMDPNIQANPFYFEDLLDDEVEDLLSCLPETAELMNKKYDLKSQLLARTSEWNQQVLNANAPSSYKQSLMDSISHFVPKKKMDYVGQDAAKIGVDLCKMNLAEDFILYSMYRENDQIKANVYKKKLMKHIQEFIDNLRRTQGRDLRDIVKDISQLRDQIMDCLYKVPLPTEDTIRDEGDEILIGFEIEQWFSDLPLYPIENLGEMLGRKRVKDNLASKINELKKHDLANYEDHLRHEIMRFLKRVPIRKEEMKNMKFMADELVNRLKNKVKDVVTGSGARRSVNFVDPHDYDQFSRDMQLCSSFSEAPEAQAQVNQSSYMIFDGTRVKDKNYIPYRDEIKQNNPESEIEWLSLFECSKVPPPPPYVRVSRGLPGATQAPGNKSLVYDPQGFSSQPGEFQNDTIVSQPQARSGFTSIRQDQQPQISIPNANVAGPYPGQAASQRYEEMSEGFPGSNNVQGSGGILAPTLPPRRSLADPKYRNLRKSLDHAEGKTFRQDPNLYSSRPQPQSFPGFKMPGDMPYSPSGATRADNFPHASFPTAKSQPNRISFDLGSNVRSRPSAPVYYGPENAPIREMNSIRPQDIEQGSRYQGQQTSSSGQDAGHLSGRECYPTDGDISQTPIGYSTPQNDVPPPREARPKKRTRHIDKKRRDAARRRLDMDDSDDSDRDEEVCRCMERIWRGRSGRNRPIYCPCEEFDMNMPPCFPMRYPPYPYYF